MLFIFIQKFEKGHGSYDATTRVVRELATYITIIVLKPVRSGG
jgi:hypothetical protein